MVHGHIKLGLAATEPRGVLAPARAGGELGEAFEGGDVAGIGRHGLLERLAFRLGITPAGGEPRL